jgi:hypothetical protein
MTTVERERIAELEDEVAKLKRIVRKFIDLHVVPFDTATMAAPVKKNNFLLGELLNEALDAQA